MNAPVLVLKAHAPGYKNISLHVGYRIIGRSVETGIRSSFVSRKHVELYVDRNSCKIRYCGKHKSQVKVDAVPVGAAWVECSMGARLEILSTPESFWYTIAQFNVASSAAASSASSARGISNGDSVAAAQQGEKSQDVDSLYHCSMCMDLYVDPTELDCDGRHLFCHQCIVNFLTEQDCSNKCPFCSTKISGKRRQDIMTKHGPIHKKRGRHGGSKKYQSQAVRLVEETIKWMIERRMLDYGDECEWRARSGLEPLPPRSTAKAPAGGGAEKGARGGGSGGGAVRSAGGNGIDCQSADRSEVIDLLSDSDDD